MLLGIKSKKIFFLRHLLIGSLSGLLLYAFWLSRSQWVIGPPGMVAEVRHLLAYLGVSDTKIHTEKFIGY